MKWCYTSHIVRKLQIKQEDTTYLGNTLIEMAKIQYTDTTKCWKDAEAQELLSIDGGNAKVYSHFGTEFGCLSQN